MWAPANPIFEVKRPANNGWNTPIAPSEPYKPEWHADSEKKQAFGEQLGKGHKPLDAALIVFNDQMPASLWAVSNWLRDPVVIAAREAVENQVNLLDKNQLSAKLLKFADEKTASGFPANEGKDRLAALKLYAEIQGYLSKESVNIQNIATNSPIKLILVEPDRENEPKIINRDPSETEIEHVLPTNVKLVG